MATDAIILLNQLTCISESDGSGHSEPYFWPVLLWIDDNTLQTPERVGVTAPALGSARVVIKNNIRAGDVVVIPSSVGMLRVRLEDGLTTRRLILAVAMWEEDETPTNAVRAGFTAYRSELRSAIADNLFALSSATEEQEAALVAAIEARVKGRVRSAIENELSWWQKARVLAGTLNMDDIIGSAFVSLADVTPTPINLAFGVGTSSEYRIQGSLRVQPVTVDPCQAQIDAVRAAQTGVDGVDQAIRSLQEELQNAGPGMKPGIIAMIRSMREEELPQAMAALEAAKLALQSCRVRAPSVPVGEVVRVLDRAVTAPAINQQVLPR